MIIISIKCGLGNQMFEYACARAMSLRNSEKLYMNIMDSKKNKKRQYGLMNLNIADIPTVDNAWNIKVIYTRILNKIAKINREKSWSEAKYRKYEKFGYYIKDRGHYMGKPDSKFPVKYLASYFQSEKYFDDYKEQIKSELKVITKPSPNNKEWIKRISSLENPICLHIRRGDFVNSKFFHVCTEDYYRKSIKKMKSMVENPTFIAFSEDIDYVKSLKLDCDILYVDENNPDYEELRLMYNCRHFIISNSSFSWWGQYLSENQNKKVIAPSKWGGAENSSKYAVYMDDWILIEP